MTTGMHPQAAEALRQVQRFTSALEDQMHRPEAESFTGTDEAKTVEVTLNGRRCLTGLRIDDSLPQLGAETVEQRINEAVRNAQAAAAATIAAGNERFIAGLVDIAGSLQKMLGLT
jgi:DNA-binding protein YbaB